VSGGGYVPERGDVVWLTLDPAAGHEQAGHRPALVISPASYNGRVGLAVVCPITSHAKGYPFEVAVTGSERVSGVVLSDAVRNVDWRARRARFVENLSPDSVRQVLKKLATLVQMPG
jgi:mRNA interferase MazF